jgi:hypothetical protein
MGKEKIAEFYDDEVKVACDAFAAEKAYYLRSLSVETAPAWHARRFWVMPARVRCGRSESGSQYPAWTAAALPRVAAQADVGER